MANSSILDAEDKACFNELLKEIEDAVEEALQNSTEILKEHIITDVYSHSVYEPKVYKRRSENSGMGVPLSDVKAYAHTLEKPAGGNANGTLWASSRLHYLDYNPSGKHRRRKWSGTNGDDLIGRIEKKDPAYNWGQDQVPPRPFWQNFITEMVVGKKLETLFCDALREKEPSVVADGLILEESEDREY